MMSFLPDKYERPSTSKYLKFKEGENSFRVLSDAVIGYEYWNTDDKPVRSIGVPKETVNLKQPKFGDAIKHFWAFKVWNYEEKRIQILQLTQPSIMEAMEKKFNNGKWGDPLGYDFIVEKKDEGGFIKYVVTTNPPEKVSDEIAEADKQTPVDLTALFRGADPFGKVDNTTAAITKDNYPTEEIKPDDIPF